MGWANSFYLVVPELYTGGALHSMEARDAPSWDRVSRWLEVAAMRPAMTKEEGEQMSDDADDDREWGPEPEAVDNTRVAIDRCMRAGLPPPTHFCCSLGHIALEWHGAPAGPLAAMPYVIFMIGGSGQDHSFWIVSHGGVEDVDDAVGVLERTLRADGFMPQ